MKKIAEMPEDTTDCIKLLLSDGNAREAVIREMLKYFKFNIKEDKVTFMSTWMERTAVKVMSNNIVKMDLNRLKIAGIEKKIDMKGVEIDNMKVEVVNGELGNIVVRGRRQAKIGNFLSDDLGKLSDECYDKEGNMLAYTDAREAVIREMLKYFKFNIKEDKVTFMSTWMERTAVKVMSNNIVKMDLNRLKIAGIEKKIDMKGVEIDNMKVEVVNGELGNIVVRGRRQAKIGNFLSDDLGKLSDECYDKEGNMLAYTELFELDKSAKFDYKPMNIRFARGEEKLPEIEDELLSPTIKFEEIVSESVQLEDGIVDIIEEKKEVEVVVEEEKGEGKEPSAKGAIDMLKEQRMVFNQGVKVKHGIVEALSYEVGMVMKVFESYDESMNRTIKLEVYSPNSSAKGVVNIVGGERAKRASLDEDGNTRDESREMATDIMAASTTKLNKILN